MIKTKIFTFGIIVLLGIFGCFSSDKSKVDDSILIEKEEVECSESIDEEIDVTFDMVKALSDTNTMGYKLFDKAYNYLNVPYSFNGRSNKKIDCMGLVFLAYTDVTGKRWQDLSVSPKQLIKSGKLGKAVEGFEGVIAKNADFTKLKVGDIIYLLFDYKCNNEGATVTIAEKDYWVWHMGLYAGMHNNEPYWLEANPGRYVMLQRMTNQPFDALIATRP
ncbi:MAG: hypothetical protein AB7T10_08310 [bacterium]